MCCISFESRRPRERVFETSQEKLRRSDARCASWGCLITKTRIQPAVSGGRIHEFSFPETLLDLDFSKPSMCSWTAGVNAESRSRLMDSIEICYPRAGRSNSWNLSRTPGKFRGAAYVQGAIRCKNDGTLYRSRSRGFFVQQSLRSLPPLPGVLEIRLILT